MSDHESLPERRILLAASETEELDALVAAVRRSGLLADHVDDPVEAMRALSRRGHIWTGLVAGDRVGRVSGLTLCGLARDAGFHRPALMLSAEPCATIAIRASLLRAAVVWLPSDSDLLERTMARLWPRTCGPACSVPTGRPGGS
jgi:DNA-binding response OmpR family regulator